MLAKLQNLPTEILAKIAKLNDILYMKYNAFMAKLFLSALTMTAIFALKLELWWLI